MQEPRVIVPSIDMEIVRVRAALPKALSDLSRLDEKKAVILLRDWGEGTKPIKQIYDETSNYLDAATSS